MYTVPETAETGSLEAEADSFAAALLMPTTLFQAAIRKAGEGFPAIEKLANTCNTSITSTAIRYTQKAEVAVAVVVSERDKISFCTMSEDFRELVGKNYLRAGDLLPKDTRTYKFNQDPLNVAEGRRAEDETTFDTWFGKGRIELKEDVVGLGNYGRTLTVLFRDETDDD